MTPKMKFMVKKYKKNGTPSLEGMRIGELEMCMRATSEMHARVTSKEGVRVTSMKLEKKVHLLLVASAR